MHPFIKRFVEERELTVLLAVDVSGSQRFGTQRHTKRAVAAEVAALIAFSAVANNDRVGLLAVSDEVERFIPPGKGTKHALRVLRDILFYEPRRPGTSLKTAFDFLNQALTRRAIVFFVSDWLDRGYESAFRLAARKHDLIAVRVSDPREESLPAAGLIEVEDAETGSHFLLDTRRASRAGGVCEAGGRAEGGVHGSRPVGQSGPDRRVHRRPALRRPGPVLPATRVPAEARAMSRRVASALFVGLLVGAAPPPAVVRLNTGDPANLIEARAQLDAGDIRLSGEVKLTLTVEGPGPLSVTRPEAASDEAGRLAGPRGRAAAPRGIARRPRAVGAGRTTCRRSSPASRRCPSARSPCGPAAGTT